MIIVKRKPLEKILEMIGSATKVLIVGCDGCVGIYQEGGQKQIDLMKIMLDMAIKLKAENLIEINTAMTLRQCDRRMCVTMLQPFINNADVLLSMACGVGVQTLAEAFEDNRVIPAHDTMFIGMQDRELGKSRELCSACGDCMLSETGTICPITRCAKALLNGPCGGQAKGKCEVGGWKKDCAWVQIHDRLKKRNKLDSFLKFRMPRDHRISQPPRDLGANSVGGEKD
jgi:hypothetical protein